MNLEDALACAEHDIVIFIDAGRGMRKPFTFRPVRPSGSFPAMSHSLSPGSVLAIAAELYGRVPDARLLAILGHSWTIGEGLSAKARKNLDLALEFLEGFLKEVRP